MRIAATTVLSVATILVASGGAAAVNFQVLDQSMSVRFDRDGLGGIAPSAREIQVDESGVPVEPTLDVTQTADSNLKTEQVVTPKPTSTKQSNNSGSGNNTKINRTAKESEPEETESESSEPTKETSKPTKTKKAEKEEDEEDDDSEDEDQHFENDDD
ncbi:MAG: hypothetical protein NT032_01350 [Actinobacteria bacterium]|nr:hypothetical protein [Actinomycetota bacterium]